MKINARLLLNVCVNDWFSKCGSQTSRTPWNVTVSLVPICVLYSPNYSMAWDLLTLQGRLAPEPSSQSLLNDASTTTFKKTRFNDNTMNHPHLTIVIQVYTLLKGPLHH